jgi:hypothetical protein
VGVEVVSDGVVEAGGVAGGLLPDASVPPPLPPPPPQAANSVAIASPMSEFLYTLIFLFDKTLRRTAAHRTNRKCVPPMSVSGDVTDRRQLEGAQNRERALYSSIGHRQQDTPMRYLPSLTLAAVAAFSVVGCASVPATKQYTIAQATGGPNCRRLAQPGDTKIQIYCRPLDAQRVSPITTPPSAQTTGDTTCRQLVPPARDKTQTVCADAARWDEFDTRAVSKGVTCRWWAPYALRKKTAPELCLSVALWNRLDSRSQAFPDSGFGWGGGITRGSPNEYQQPYATSYGPFPAGGAIGAPFP